MNLNMTPLAEGLTLMGARTTAYDQRRVFASRSVVRRYLAAHHYKSPVVDRSIDSLITRDIIRTVKETPNV